MIDRYCLENMKHIWELNSKFKYYLDVELAVCEAYKDLGKIPDEDYKYIKKHASFNVDRISEIETKVHHDVIAFITNVNETVGDKSKYIHNGLTSSDVIDTALSLQLRDASAIIKQDFEKILKTIMTLAKKYKNTICIGRSHGIHAEVTTFGIKMLNMYDCFERAYKNFSYISENIQLGMISGPVGTYSNVPVELERLVCEKLGLTPARISTQIIARDNISRYMNELAVIASIIEQCATEFRNLQRTEIFEVQEFFDTEQKGSSAMPHKRNPVLCENLCGLARVVRSNSQTAMQNIVLWHERDISHSSAERIILPDSTILIDFMLNRFNDVLSNLVIYEKNMLKNTKLYGGIVYSQRVMLKLVESGLSREQAYQSVQKNALAAIDNNGSFEQNLLNDKDIMDVLSKKQIISCFDENEYLKNVDAIFAKFKI